MVKYVFYSNTVQPDLDMHTSTVTRKGQIVIPAPLRRKLGFEEGMKVIVTETDGGVHVEPLDRAYFDGFAGFLSGGGRSVGTLIEARREDKKRENRHS